MFGFTRIFTFATFALAATAASVPAPDGKQLLTLQAMNTDH
jgi:hypothetical protein